MFDKWWENNPRVKHWYENTHSNATTVCPDWVWKIAGIDLGLSGVEHAYSVENEIGYRTENKIIRKAGNIFEKTKALRSMGYALCLPAYGAGAVDALYQEFHGDIHIGMAIGDWAIETAESIQHWYVSTKGSIYHWWEHEDHWWK